MNMKRSRSSPGHARNKKTPADQENHGHCDSPICTKATATVKSLIAVAAQDAQKKKPKYKSTETLNQYSTERTVITMMTQIKLPNQSPQKGTSPSPTQDCPLLHKNPRNPRK